MADILLILVKHRIAQSRLHIFTMPKCDGEAKFPKIFKEAKEMVKKIKGPNKKKLVADERIKLATQRLEAKFGRFHCKIIASCKGNKAEVLVTSASFHKWHYEFESGDVVCHFKLTTEDLINNYLAPLGLEHQVVMESSSAETSAATTPATSPVSAPEGELSLPTSTSLGGITAEDPQTAGTLAIRPLSHYSTSSRS